MAVGILQSQTHGRFGPSREFDPSHSKHWLPDESPGECWGRLSGTTSRPILCLKGSSSAVDPAKTYTLWPPTADPSLLRAPLMDPSTQLERELHILPILFWSRYVSLSALVVLLWDHCLTFKYEVQLIWPSRASFVKRTFLANRYIVPVILSVSMHTQSGLGFFGLTDEQLKNDEVVNSAILYLSRPVLTCSAQLQSLVDDHFRACDTFYCRIPMAYCVETLATLGWKAQLGDQTVCVALVVSTGIEAWPNITFNTMSNMCALGMRPKMLTVLYAWLLAFELCAYALVCHNALSRPREKHQALLQILRRDGIVFFFLFFTVNRDRTQGTVGNTILYYASGSGLPLTNILIQALRILNLLMTLLDVPTQIFLGIYCIWAFITTIVSRMVIDVRSAEISYRDDVKSDQESSLTSYETCQLHSELPVCIGTD
ncbi:hypothetical protein K439DRAFT_1619244 [Ramaria rubella]|nr:hypothetical protein K439DRAFT_1619244 [Ramaria rubella]